MLWKIGERVFDLSRRGMIMGVLNVTPDSFSDGGEFFDSARAVAHGRQLAGEGADIIDIGGESTRPGAAETSAEDELARVLPVIAQLRADGLKALISIDTTKAKVAERALAAGAQIINDISGGLADPEMFPLAVRTRASIVIMHMQGTPRTMQEAPVYRDVVAEVREFFRQQSARALSCGIDPMAMAFDPGIGFGKTLEHNLALLRNLDALRVPGRPLAVGVSRKSFLGKLIGSEEMADRSAPTVAFTALLRARGANILRVHEVKGNIAALRAAEAILETAP